MKLLSFGEVLWDIYPDKKCLGGAPLNFVSHFVRQGGEGYIISAVGNDKLGALTQNSIEELGVSTRYLTVIEDKITGRCEVTLDENCHPKYDLADDVAYDYISVDRLLGKEFDILYFGTLALRREYNRSSLNKLLADCNFKEVFVDVNLRAPFYSKEVVRFVLENATVLKISDEELPMVCELIGVSFEDYRSVAKTLSKWFNKLRCVVITLGSNGAYAFDCIEKKEHFCKSEKVNVVSTVGAGDSFSAGFAYSHFCGDDIEKSLKFATKLAGFVVSNYEAVPKYDKNTLL